MTEYDETFGLPVAFAPRTAHEHLPGDRRPGRPARSSASPRPRSTPTSPSSSTAARGAVSRARTGCLVPSPRDVATYDLKPEMSAARGHRRAACSRLARGKYDFIARQLRQPRHGRAHRHPRRGHQGGGGGGRVRRPALAGRARRPGIAMLITADHGNCEMMVDPVTGQPHTAHTLNPVPFILADPDFRGAKLRDEGRPGRRGAHRAPGHGPAAAEGDEGARALDAVVSGRARVAPRIPPPRGSPVAPRARLPAPLRRLRRAGGRGAVLRRVRGRAPARAGRLRSLRPARLGQSLRRVPGVAPALRRRPRRRPLRRAAGRRHPRLQVREQARALPPARRLAGSPGPGPPRRDRRLGAARPRPARRPRVRSGRAPGRRAGARLGPGRATAPRRPAARPGDAPQVGQSRVERARNVAGAFQAHPSVSGRDLLLVDDVVTTGATAAAAAGALRAAGARSVVVIALARAE